MAFFQKADPENQKASYGLPFNLARFFSWVTLVVVLISSIILAVFIGQSTTSTLLESQKDYALLMAENLNKQLFRNFIAPRLIAERDGIAISAAEQYMLLDQLVLLLVHGLHIESIRIYDHDFNITYSTKSEEVGATDSYSPDVPHVFNSNQYRFDVLATIPYAEALLTPSLPEDSYLLRTTYPLTMDLSYKPILENVLGPLDVDDNELLGVLEITQDITSHYYLAIRSQRWILVGFMFSCLILFVLIQIMARQAERILGERVQRNLELEANLHQNEKLASMGRMVASIAHEIRNPLGIIRSSAELLLRRMKTEDPSSKAILEAIYDESCRLGVTVTDFLDYARPKQPRNTAVDVQAVIDKVLGFLSSELEKTGITVKSNLTSPLWIQGDEDLLYRAFYNILVNAQQAMDGVGTITIESFLEKNSIHIRFQDSGPGFEQDKLDKPLDPFYTTKDSGTGLGLPIVQSIIGGHKGQVLLKNAPEGGAVIEIILPANHT